MKYSVLMSLYCKEKPEYLVAALDSMIHQTLKPDEIVLVEDGPLTDDLRQVVEEYKDQLSIVVNPQNLGLGLALNEGLKACKNDLVARMDTDDVSKPDRCEKQVKKFEMNPGLAIVGSHIDEFVGTTDNVISSRIVPVTQKEIYEFAKRRSAFNHPTVMYRKSVVLAEGGYADMKRNQDVDLFGRMLFHGCQAENIDESLLWFRTSNELSARRRSWENTKSYVATIRRFWKIGFSSFGDYLKVLVAQIAIYIMPVRLQNWVYGKFLRK